jgi:DNA-directed RNA polymerase subunit RPC12/RpoP
MRCKLARRQETPSEVQMISFTCRCGKALLAHNEQAAEEMPCPECGRVLVVPAVENIPTTARCAQGAPLDGVRTAPEANLPPAAGAAQNTRGSSPWRPPAEVDQFTDKAPALGFDAAATNRRPAGQGCPRCGATAFTRLKPVKGTALTADRKCQACGTRYLTIPASMSGAMQAAVYTSGVVLILAGVLAAVLWLAGMEGPGVPRPTFQLYGVLFSFMMAFNMFSWPQQDQQQREKRWQDYKASAPADAPPPVEMSRSPDAVSISILFGALALTAPLISTLLTVLVFGPAAIVCGVIALAQGHLKGLIGMVLGVVGLIVWLLVFGYFFTG